MNQLAIRTMLEMQNRMNTRVHEAWIDQAFEWYRAVWIECGELMDHIGYKWWKKQTPDMEQVRLEVVDIWHFGMSALFSPDKSLDVLANEIAQAFSDADSGEHDLRLATEALAQDALATKGFSVVRFAAVMRACRLSEDELYRHYVGKNVLNLFRQDHGYQDGTYVKLWQGREDNEHLSELLELLDDQAADFPDQVYTALAERYRNVA